MKNITIDEENKKKIYEHVQKNVGYYIHDYEKEIESLNVNGTLDKEFATRILENLIYSCKITKLQLKLDKEFEEEVLKSDKIFNNIPKSTDYNETEYMRESNVEIYNDMEVEKIWDYLQICLNLEIFYSKVQFVQNLKERANMAIDSIKSIDEHKEEISIEDRIQLEEISKDLNKLLSQRKNRYTGNTK